MLAFLIVTAGAALVGASPRAWPGEKDWWHSAPHHGWPTPSVYTPAQPQVPAPTWLMQSSVTASATSYYSAPSNGTASINATASTSSPTAGSPSNACASVSELARSYTESAGPSATAVVPAGLAWECITSVPFNHSAAVTLLDAMRPYLNWQTTLSYIKEPPAEYADKVQAPYDFFEEFERIYAKAQADDYPNERSFGWDVYRAFQRTHDGHFVYYIDSVNLIFSFGRTTPLVSVSIDGESIPEVYVYSDILASAFGNLSYTPSPLAKIDGIDSTEFLLDWSQYGSLQDPDALWNNLFYLLAQVSLGPQGSGTGTFSGGGRGRWVYPGESTTLTFKNGSSITNENFANVLVPFDGINSGADIYTIYFTPPEPESAQKIAVKSYSSSIASSTSSASFSSSSSSTTVPAPGYPTPVIREPNNLNGGYFLDGDGYDDVAVLSVPSFVGEEADEIPFQIVNTYFLNYAKAQGKKKLIIDVSANGGGTILQGYDLFKQLFPSILPYGATRFRAHEALDIIGQEVSWYTGLFPRSLETNNSDASLASTAYNYRTDADENYEPFGSWADKYGPRQYGPGDDEYTNIIRWNLSDVLTELNSGGIVVSGYLERANITEQPFAAQDIVIVYDGYCASTCTIFSELAREQAGVKTIALGGRPNKNIIQAVGGVKGTNSYPWSYILYSVLQPFRFHHYHDGKYYQEETELGEYSDLPLYRATNWVTNARDGLRKGDESQLPLQFYYEPADCRIYYTPASAVDQTAVWKTVADTAWGGIDNCVAGGYSSKKRSAKSAHRVRRDMSIEEHYRAMAEVWTGKNDISMGGDGFMLP